MKIRKPSYCKNQEDYCRFYASGPKPSREALAQDQPDAQLQPTSPLPSKGEMDFQGHKAAQHLVGQLPQRRAGTRATQPEKPSQSAGSGDWVSNELRQQAAVFIQRTLRFCLNQRKLNRAIRQRNLENKNEITRKVLSLQKSGRLVKYQSKLMRQQSSQSNRCRVEGRPMSAYSGAQQQPRLIHHMSTHTMNTLKRQEQEKLSIGRKRKDGRQLKQIKLQVAAKTNNIYMAKSSGFMYYPEDVDAKDPDGNCPLFYATQNKDREFIEFLLDLKADVNIQCEEGNAPIHLVFLMNDEQMILKFLERGGDLNLLNDKRQTPVAFASQDMLDRLCLSSATAKVSLYQDYQLKDNNRILVKDDFLYCADDQADLIDEAPYKGIEFEFDYLETATDTTVRHARPVYNVPGVKAFKQAQERDCIEEKRAAYKKILSVKEMELKSKGSSYYIG